MNNHLSSNIEGSQWQEIWTKFKKGDRKAFELIYNEHIDFLYGYGKNVTPNSELVEDAIQDLFFYLLSKREKIVTPNYVRFYLLRAFKRILIEKIKKEKSFSTDIEGDSFRFDFYFEIDTLSKKQIEERKIELIEKLIDQLDSNKKEVIYLKFHSGLNYDEIGEIVGIKPSSVKKLVYRTISSFREIIKNKTLELLFLFSKISANQAPRDI